VYAGEDPHFIFRRMLIFASEDVGMADPNALVFTEAAAAAFDRVGLPEGRFHLANAALYLSTAPKSNSIFAFFDALNTVEDEKEGEVPRHLKDGSRDKESFGHGEGYLYPHAYRDHWVAQQYLPESLQGKIFYEPGSLGYEATLKTEIEKRREAQLSAMFELTGDHHEILTFSPTDSMKERWLARAAGSLSGYLGTLRDRLFSKLVISRHWIVLDINADHGLLTWELARRTPEGGVWARIDSTNSFMKDMIKELPELDRPVLIDGELGHIKELIEEQGEPEVKFDLVVGRNALGPQVDKEKVLQDLSTFLQKDGFLSLAEAVPRWGQRISELVDASTLPGDLNRRFKEAETRIYTDPDNSRVSWDHETLEALLMSLGFQDIDITKEEYFLQRTITSRDLDHWFTFQPKPSGFVEGLRYTMKDNEIRALSDLFRKQLEGVEVPWKKSVLFLYARKH
jgi:putative ATPase